MFNILSTGLLNSYNIGQDNLNKNLFHYKNSIHSLKKSKKRRKNLIVNIPLHIHYKQMMKSKFGILSRGYYKMCSLFLGEDILESKMCKMSSQYILNILMDKANILKKLNSKDLYKRGIL